MSTNTLLQPSQAGTLESGDIQIFLSPAADAAAGISIHLTSPVLKKFGSAIRSVLTQELAQAGLTQVEVTANDRGALDCTIRARILTAIERGLTKEEQ